MCLLEVTFKKCFSGMSVRESDSGKKYLTMIYRLFSSMMHET